MKRVMVMWLFAVAGLVSVGCQPAMVTNESVDDPELLGTGDDEVDVGDGSVATASTDSDVEAPDNVLAEATFRHPGVLFNGDQLAFIKQKVKAGAQPWKSAYDKARSSDYGGLKWKPRPRAVVNCGSKSNPNEGCSDEREDAVAAYTNALLGYIDDDPKHTDVAIDIMNAWAKTIKSHTGHNAPLQTGWAGVMFPRAAEIVRHTTKRWTSADLQRFEKTLRDVYLPTVSAGRGGGTNGNWELIMTEATISIAVFLDDKPAFNRAVALWRNRVPAYIYQKQDGAYPKAPNKTINTPAKLVKFWQGQSTFVDGLSQETCRDFGHTAWGIGAAIATAETALQQGLDLYQENGDRLKDALEFHAQYMVGAKPPKWLCGGSISNTNTPTWEIGFNHFHNRHGASLPFSQKFIESKERKQSEPVSYFIAWETLTHAEVGSVGLK